MMNIVGLNYLCRPAYIYVVISLILLIIYGLAVSSNSIEDTTQIGSTSLYIFINIIIIILITWFLNYLCRKGYVGTSWFIMILYFIISIISSIYIILTNQVIIVDNTTI